MQSEFLLIIKFHKKSGRFKPKYALTPTNFLHCENKPRQPQKYCKAVSHHGAATKQQSCYQS